MGRERNESGQYNDRIEPDTVRKVFEQRTDQAEPITATDIVDEMDIARRTAHNKLNELTERGVLETKKIGARGRVWWTPIVEAHTETAERSESEDVYVPERTPEATENDTQPREMDTGELEDSLRSTLPGSGSVLEDRIGAVLKMYSHLRDKQGDTVRTGELKSLIDGDGLGYKDTNSFWSNAVKKNAAQDRPNSLTSLPGVDELGNGRYRYSVE